MSYLGQGYLLNHTLLTSFANCEVVLSNVSDILTSLSSVLEVSMTDSFTILKQPVSGLIMVRHIPSRMGPFCPSSVYGPIISTHNTSHGFVITHLGGTWP